MQFGLAPHSGTFLLNARAAKQRADKSSALAECAWTVKYIKSRRLRGISLSSYTKIEAGYKSWFYYYHAYFLYTLLCGVLSLLSSYTCQYNFYYHINGINLYLVFWQYSLYPFKLLDKTFSSLRILNARETGSKAKGISPQYEPRAIGVGINIISTPMYIGWRTIP